MLRRALLTVVPVVLVLGACGSSDSSDSERSTAPTSTVGEQDGPGHSNDAGVALVSLDAGWEGSPDLVIGGDRWVYFPAPERSEAAGFARLAPLPPEARPFQRRRLTEAGLATVLNEAERLGLLAEPPEYEDPESFDTGSTSVTFDVGDGTFKHVARDLGGVETGDRNRLATFVEVLDDLEGFVGADQLGPVESWVPERYVVEELTWFDVAETSDAERMWPVGVPIEYGCVELPIEQFPNGVAGLYVAENDVSVEVAPDLPGDICT